ncbi:MAG: hypothetical protein ABTQ26_12270 [Azonexus sp.]
MTDAELKQQPRSVREEFEKIKNSEVDGDQQIIDLKTQLEDATAKRREAQQIHDNARGCLEFLPGAIALAENKIEEIKAKRASAIATALLAETENDHSPDFSSDDELITQLRSAELYLERLRLSVNGVHQQEKQARRTFELTSNPCIALETSIATRREQVKLAEARRRHGY